MTNAIPSEPEQRPPVRGWLLVLCLWMTVFPAVVIGLIIAVLIGLIIIDGATMPAGTSFVLLIAGAVMLAFPALAMVIGILLWMRKRAGLIAAKVYFAAFLILGSLGSVIWLILAGIGWFWLPAMLADMGKGATDLVALVVASAPWLMYLNRSKRVRATFAPPTGQRPPMGSIMQVAPQANPVSSEGKCAARGPVQPSASTSDNEIYEIVANEIDAGNVSKGLWTRLYAEAEGDENKTKVLYIT